MPGRRRRTRDRHGRGLRGPLVPSHVPLARSPAQQFDDLVVDAVEHFGERWARELAALEVAVEDVPPDENPDTGEPVPLARLELPIAPAADTAPRLVVYRRPVEARATGAADLADLVHDVVLDQVAQFLGLDPDVVDPPG